MTAIGIDFGTTNSVAAVFADGSTNVLSLGQPSAVWDEMGFAQVLPSVVALDADRQLVFGWQAKQLDTDKKFEAIKRLFREEETVTQGEELFYVEEIAAALFAHIKQRALATGLDAESAVITIPANSRGLARHRTKVCAGMGGIKPLALINEPTAAAMAYARRHDIDQQQVLVFDFGGGTLDVTVLAVHDGVFFEQGSSGIGRLGGFDFDSAIMRHISDESPDSANWSAVDKTRLRLEIERAKIRLSSNNIDETVIAETALPGGAFRLTRPQFDQLTHHLVERSGEAIRRTLTDLRMSSSSVDQVLLVGGTSKVPAVRQYVAELLDKDPATGIDPMTAVGEGAAIAAAIMTGRLTDNDFFLSTEHAMGTIVADPVARTLRFSPVILKNQKLPAKQTETFTPVMDFQESVNVRVMEGDPELPLDHPDNLLLAEFPVPLDPPRPADEVEIELTYTYDTDGLVHVEVVDGTSGIQLVEPVILSSQGALGGRALVEMASRVKASVEDGAAVPETAVPASPLPPESAALIATARSKVIPFVDDEDAAKIKSLVEAVEQADEANRRACHAELETVLNRFSYLL
jgi:molecular chaperone DnaK (HSP70)